MRCISLIVYPNHSVKSSLPKGRCVKTFDNYCHLLCGLNGFCRGGHLCEILFFDVGVSFLNWAMPFFGDSVNLRQNLTVKNNNMKYQVSKKKQPFEQKMLWHRSERNRRLFQKLK